MRGFQRPPKDEQQFVIQTLLMDQVRKGLHSRPTKTPTETPTKMPTKTAPETPTKMPTKTPTETPTKLPPLYDAPSVFRCLPPHPTHPRKSAKWPQPPNKSALPFLRGVLVDLLWNPLCSTHRLESVCLHQSISASCSGDVKTLRFPVT